jgi:outer membrane protein assembly factor BamB
MATPFVPSASRSALTRLAMATAVAAAVLSAADVTRAAQSPEQLLAASGVRGGLIVHVGCGDGSATAALAASERCVVQGLDRSPANVVAARRLLVARGLNGRATAREWTGAALPYNDNLVNVLLVEKAGAVARDEMLRVLVPNGTAYVKEAGGWTKLVKPRPSEIDDWTHCLHNPTGNAVSQDRVVAPVKHLQWFAGPRYGRQHEHMSSVSAVVSAGGRVFSIIDEGSPASLLLPSDWQLEAKDAFNGVTLWKRPIAEWFSRYFPMKNGPSILGHRLVATDKTLYATVGLNAPISAIDAGTGKTIREYPETAGTLEFVLSDGVLFAVVGKKAPAFPQYVRKLPQPVPERDRIYAKDSGYAKAPRVITALDPETGKILWTRDTKVSTLTLTVDSQNVVYHDNERVVCLDRASGKERWKSKELHANRIFNFGRGGTMVLHKDVVLYSAVKGDVTALSGKDGKVLWTAPQPGTGHHSAQDVFVIDDLVWYGETGNGRSKGMFYGRNLHTGKVVREFAPDIKVPWFHHRCHRGRATVNYILASRTGIEFVDFRKEHWDVNHWVRGACALGIIPANGLMYAPPHPCGCYLSAKLSYFNALSPTAGVTYKEDQASPAERLEKGPAYGTNIKAAKEVAAWPQYRNDVTRSGSTPHAVASKVKTLWQAKVGGKLSRLVAAGGKLFVAAVDAHTLHAIDAESGRACWQYTTGGRIDSPPSCTDGLVVFGSADGYVYCLTAADGKLAWRYRAAPQRRQMMALSQLESPWPVHGSVLVRPSTGSGQATAYCTAGRQRFLDGGILLLALDVQTGRLVSEKLLDKTDDATGKDLHEFAEGLEMPVALSDILSANDKYLFMHEQVLDFKGTPVPTEALKGKEDDTLHLFTPTGFLDDSWFHRTYWLYSGKFNSGWNRWYLQGQVVPAGRVLVHQGDSVLGYGRKQTYFRWSTPLDYHLFRMRKKPPLNKKTGRKGSYQTGTEYLTYDWSKDIPLTVTAMTLADKTLFVAGPPDLLDEEAAWKNIYDPKTQQDAEAQLKSLQGAKGSALWALSAETGEKLSECPLPSAPIYDGMAAAYGKLYVALADGSVVCLGGRK